MKALVITGSRHLTTVQACDMGMWELIINGSQWNVVIHGGATGADAIAGCYARDRGISVLPMPAQWEKYAKLGYRGRAGPARNAHMATVAKSLRECGWEVECHAFPLGKSPGTRGCTERLEHAGFDVTVHEAERP